MATEDYLTIPGLSGDVASGSFAGDFTVSSYFTGSTNLQNQPLTVDLSVVSGGANQLLLDAENGTVLPTVTLQEVRSGGATPTIEQITLTDATVSSVQEAGGEVAVSFDYKTETVQPYVEHADGSLTAGTPVTHAGGTFAAPTAQVLPVANSADNYFLNVPGISGTVTASGESGDFQTTGYQFATGPSGQAGPLMLTLEDGNGTQGVADLEQADWSGQDLGTVTLDVQKAGAATGTVEMIQLQDAHVVSFTDPNGAVSVALSYSQASITNYTQNADGSYAPPTTIKLGASTIPSQVAPVTPGLPGSASALLQVSGVSGDITRVFGALADRSRSPEMAGSHRRVLTA
jgi:type VI protein secretion system component Hcp